MKTVDFSETIAASDLKFGRNRHLNVFMKVSEYLTARSTLVTYAFLWEKVKTVDFSETIAACDL